MQISPYPPHRNPRFSRFPSSAPKLTLHSCLRALFPTQSPNAVSSALAFCATYTTTVNTATTGFPTRATGGCGTATARYSSACSCKPTTTSTPPGCAPTPAANLVKDGNFECGLSPPWVPRILPDNYGKLSSPGDNSPTAFEYDQYQVPPDFFTVSNLAQNITGLTVGKNYNVTYSAYFGACEPQYGFVGVMPTGSTFDACDRGQAAVGKFFPVDAGQFTASATVQELRFDFVIGIRPAVVKIDNVAVVPA